VSLDAAQTGPLAFQQERLWFLHQLDPLGAAYNMPFTVRIDGKLRADAVKAGLDAAVRRHDVLRTRFPMVDGRPVQVVEREGRVPLQLADLTALPRERRSREAACLARADVVRPFDLAEGGLARALLLKLDDDQYRLVLVLHHIITDGVAAQLLLREIVDGYRSVVGGLPSALADLPCQYSDYVAWQRDPLRQAMLDRQLDFWKSRLAGAPDWIDLPADRPPPAAPSSRGGSRPLRISAEMVAALRGVVRQERSTLFVFLLATLQVLLYRYSGQTDIVVGIPVSDRRHSTFERLIGFFGNIVLIRSHVTGELRFRDLLRAAQNELLDALDNQDVPFDRVVQALRPRRNARIPLFQVMLALDESDRSPVIEVDEGLRIRPFDEDRQGAIADLSLCISAHPQDIDGYVEFAMDRFGPDTIDRLIGHLHELLRGAVADTTARVADLPLLTPAERRQIRRLNQAPATFPNTQGMHRLFEAQARLTPRRPALVWGLREVTYNALDREANRIAHELVAVGVGRGSFVGVQANRSPNTVAALLGVLKAGAAYVGLDPDLGERRIRFALDDLSVRVIVADAPLAGAPAALARIAPRLNLEDAGPTPRGCERAPDTEVSGEDLAYAIYTSGSTGTPKAVGISHGAAANFLHWAATSFSPDELKGVLASTSPVFDCVLFEIFAPLSWGGTAVLARSALDLATLPARGRVTLVSAVPTTMQELLRQTGMPPGVVTVNLVGDVVPELLVRTLDDGTTNLKIYNHYGPSEATTYATGACLADGAGSARHPSVAGGADRASHIGRPVAGAEVYVADGHLNLVPAGVPGELFIGGPALARGYIGSPGRTAERFLPDRWSGRPGARVYRTGDLGRYLSDGSLDFLGRADRQVKLRGFRVEPAEVESALDAHPQVQRSVVVALDEPDGERRLVGYYVAAGEQVPDPAELIAHVRSRLPSVMVPSVLVPLGSLPLTGNGKVDHKALPPPGGPASAGPWRSEPPRTVVEIDLAQAWLSILGQGGVGVTEDFFDLGGSSLRMVALAAHVEAAFGVQLSLSDLLAAPTIREQARLVQAALAELPHHAGG